MELRVVQVREDGRWRAVAAIDERNYPDHESYDQAVRAVRHECSELRLPTQTVTSDVTPDQQVWPLPTWAEYRETLKPDPATLQRACVLLAEYLNDGLQRYTADSFQDYLARPYVEWLHFLPPASDGNHTFLVNEPMVYEVRGGEPVESAVARARILKDAGATRREASGAQEGQRPAGE